MAIFEQGAFQQNPNDTPETIKRKRQMIREAMMNYGSASNVGEGIGQLLNGIATGVQMRGVDRAEQAGLASGQEAQSKIFDAMMGRAKTTPAAMPASAPTSSAPSSMSPYRDAIASIESKGSGDYAAVGPTHSKLGRALGRYQIMEANIPVWSKEVLGRPVTADEFMANPQLQDQIFDGKFQSYVNKFGPEGAAQAWLGGPGGVGKLNRKDSLGTSIAEYGQRFTKALGAAPQVASLDPSVGMAYAAQQPQSGADKVFSAIMPQTQQTAPQMPMRGGSGLDVWQGRATQGTATDGTRLTRLPNGSIQRTNRFGVTERMSPEGESMGASMGARQPMQQPQQVAQAAFNPQPVAPLAAQQPAQTGQADSAPIPMSGGLNLQELMAQAQNPWLDESSRAFANDLIQKELQKQDPAYQQAQKMKDLEYQKTQLELDQMKNPPPKWDVVTGKDGSVFRINPQTGDHEVIYGPQAEPLKPTGDIQEYEYAKKQGFTGTFAEYQQQMKKAGAQSINIDQKAEGQFDKTLAEKQAASFDTMATEGMNAKADIAVIGELGNLLKGQGGMLTGLSGALAKYGIGGEGIGDLQAADALINKLIPSQRAPGSGSMSDRDVEMFRSSLPSLWKTPGGNQILLNTMQSLAQYKQAQGDIAQRVMIGEIDRKDAVRLLRELPNPLESFRSGTQAQPSAAPQAAPQSAPAQPSAAPIKIQSIEDYNRVPSGAQYVDPQGVVRIKK